MSQEPSTQTITSPSENNAPMNSNLPSQPIPSADANDTPNTEFPQPPTAEPDCESPISRTASQSSHNTSSTHSTIDASLKVTAPTDESWSAATTDDLMNLNFEQFKERHAQAARWKACKLDLKKYVARIKDNATARKFETEIKVIGRR